MTIRRSLFILACAVSVLGSSVRMTSAVVQDGEFDDARKRAEEVLASEDVIEGDLRKQLVKLSNGALNLDIPGAGAVEIFEPEVTVIDLSGEPAGPGRDVLRLDIQKTDWKPVGRTTLQSRDSMTLWAAFLDGVDFFHHAKFYTVRGNFTDDRRDHFHAKSGFKGLAQLSDGTLASIKAKLDLTWTRASDPDRPSWRISRFETGAFSIIQTERPLFSDVIESALGPDDLARARRSTRDEGLAGWVHGITSGQVDLDEAIEGVKGAFLAGEFPLDMSHVCVVDIDLDGRDDLYVAPSNARPMLLKANADGTFEDIAESVNLAHDKVHGALFSDFDNDGDPDALLSFYPGETCYYLNDGGRFVERNDLFNGDLPRLVLAMSPVDFNNDGLLDVYFSRYNGIYIGAAAAKMEAARAAGDTVEVSFPELDDEEAQELYRRVFAEDAEPFVNRPGPQNQLFVNLGHGRFARAENAGDAEQWQQTMAASFSDIDLDGDMDLYVVNEAGSNQLVRNNGDGTFTNITEGDTSDVGFGMGLGWGDYDNDGRQDFYVTNMYSKAGLRIADQMKANEKIARAARGNTLIRNGPDGFKRVSGIDAPDLLVEAADFGWGGAFADFNNDGHLDLYAPAGYVSMPPEVASVGES